MSKNPQVALLSMSCGPSHRLDLYTTCWAWQGEGATSLCWDAQGRDRASPPSAPHQALWQGRAPAGLLADLRDHHEEGRGQAPLGQGRICQRESHGALGRAAAVSWGFPEGASLPWSSACPRLRSWDPGAERVTGRKGSTALPRPSCPLHPCSNSSVLGVLGDNSLGVFREISHPKLPLIPIETP